MRSNWFEEEPARRFTIPPLSSWRGADLLSLALVVCFVLQLTPLGLTEWFGLSLGHVAQPLYWFQFATYALVHSTHDPLHLGFNCLALYFFGRQVEADIGGRKPFLWFCLAAAVIASILFVVWEFAFGAAPNALLIGASGITYACLVAFATANPQADVVFFIFPMKAWALAALFMLITVFYMATMAGGGIAHPAHLGGGLFGFAFIRHRHRFDGLLERRRARRRVHAHQREIDRRREVDRILEKISRNGISSLTRSERRFLDSASRDYRSSK